MANFYQHADFTEPMVVGMEDIHELALRLEGAGIKPPDVAVMFATFLGASLSEAGPDNVIMGANAVRNTVVAAGLWSHGGAEYAHRQG